MENSIEGMDEAKLRERLAWVVMRGSLVFHLDLATALAREAAAAALPEERDFELVADVGPVGYRVDVLSADLDRQLGSVEFLADGRPAFDGRQGTATERARRLAAAAATVRDSVEDVHDERYTTVVIPSSATAMTTDPITVYRLRLGERPDDIAVGVHQRLTVSDDGRSLIAADALARAPLVILGADVPAGEVTFSHVLDDTPTEVHVYLSLKHGIPLSVITVSNEVEWQVSGESIAIYSASDQSSD